MASGLQLDISYRQILKIALPISLALLVPNFNFIINNIFLGHLDEGSLATASITGVYYLIFSAIGYGLNNGLQALISRRAGQNRPEEIGLIFRNGILLAILIAITGIILTYLVTPFLLKPVIHSEEVYQKAISFLNIRILGLPFLFIYQLRNALLVGINKSKLLIGGTVAEALTNILLDYIFIFGKFGFPALGFNGAAYASVIAEFTGMFVIFLVIRRKGIDREFALFGKMKWDPAAVRSVLRMSGPLIFQHAISIISWFFFYILIERNSTQTDLAVSNTMRNIFGFFGVFSWAFAATTNTMVSNIIGQGRKEDMIPLLKKIMMISCSLALFVFIFLQLFPATYLEIYGRDDDFINSGIPVIRVVATAMLFMSFSTIWLNAVTGTGNSRVTFLIELSAIIFYCLYVFLVLEVYKLSLVWAWMSEFLYWTLLFSLSYAYIKSRRWHATVV